MKDAVYFDMDGVLCDWVAMYEKVYGDKLPLAKFNILPKAEKHKIKDEIFSYKFFRDMKPIDRGMKLIKHYLKDKKCDVFILSAVGDSKHVKEIERAKREWVKQYLGDVECLFVDKVQNKSIKKKDGYAKHILFDDRKKAIDAWNAKGGEGFLFV